MIEKNLKKDSPNSRVVSEWSRSVVDLKLKSEKLRTESLMPFVLLKLPFLKVLFQEEEQLFFTLHLSSISFLNNQTTLLKEKSLVLESFNTPLEFHWLQFAKTLDSKVHSLPLNCWKKPITKKDSTLPTELTLTWENKVLLTQLKLLELLWLIHQVLPAWCLLLNVWSMMSQKRRIKTDFIHWLFITHCLFSFNFHQNDKLMRSKYIKNFIDKYFLTQV